MIIEAHDLRKTFVVRRGRGKTEKVEAVRGIDLAVKEGEIFAALGPNGAGKPVTKLGPLKFRTQNGNIPL